MKLVLISKYFTPNDSVDAISSAQLINALRELNPEIEIHVVTSNHNYKNSKYDELEVQKHPQNIYKTHLVKSIYRSNNKVLQFLSMIIDGFRLVLKARSLKVKNIISLTNPPLIVFWCALLLGKRRWYYWSFDIYPDALSASNILSEKNLLYRFLSNTVYKYPPSALISLGKKQRDYLFKNYKTSIPTMILPCGIISTDILPENDIPDWYKKNKNYIGYLGNVGMAHSKEYIIEVINNLGLLTDFNLVLAIYGEHKYDIENYVKSNNFYNVIVIDKVERKHLSLIDIHLVSLLQEWTNISVPSKAVSAVCSGSALMFYGSAESDTWDMFKDCSFLVKHINDIPSIFLSITQNETMEKKINAQRIASSLQAQEKSAFEKIYAHLSN